MTTHETIVQLLRKRLNNQTYPVGSRFPSDSELAEELHLNIRTVNKAVSVLAAEGYLKRGIRRLPTVVLRDHPVNNAPVILFAESLYPPTINRFVEGLQGAALNRDFAASVVNVPGNLSQALLKYYKLTNLKAIITSHYDLLVPPGKVPVLYFDSVFPDHPDVNNLNCDNFHGGELIAEELIRNGHRNIAILTNHLFPYHMEERRNGMLAAMNRAGIKADQRNIFCVEAYSERAFWKKYTDIRKVMPQLTAIAADSDDTAAFLYRACQQNGVRIPDDLSITGFGNLEWARLCYNFTSIEQHPFEQGIRAVELIEELLTGAVPEPIHEITPVDLVRGSSVRQISS